MLCVSIVLKHSKHFLNLVLCSQKTESHANVEQHEV